MTFSKASSTDINVCTLYQFRPSFYLNKRWPKVPIIAITEQAGVTVTL
jgi:hypothetical protein